MGKEFLLDTNTVIYFLNGSFPEPAMDFLEKMLNEKGSIISIVTKIELLGWQTPNKVHMAVVESLVRKSTIVPLTDLIAEKAILIRRVRKIKLPDAVIAASAILGDYTLISRNDKDFKGIANLSFMNLFTDKLTP
ncbi:type II toxin-antitoxin system VapC family toxin [Phaeodactylibacter xiamenensis]|uniref:type II toxin-antitoxin system VapC family toxin n=1 Tax=Phaeodactylibacter xiamenensis TaxID=1524460 RepID=UPI0024A7C7AE|nr:type II toxin-antitoxin system VapC family toxin [Phaeodactylibacter xiamenensis]